MDKNLSINFSKFYSRVCKKMSLPPRDVKKTIRDKMWPIVLENEPAFWKFLNKKVRKNIIKSGLTGSVCEFDAMYADYIDDENVENITTSVPLQMASRFYEFTSPGVVPEVSGDFVYHIITPGSAKVGKHHGSLKKLCSRYNTPCLEFTASVFDCYGYDYSQIEKMIHMVLTTAGKHKCREHFTTDSVGVFKDVLEAFFENVANYEVVNHPVDDTFAVWYADWTQKLTTTNDVSDFITARTIHDEYNRYCLEREIPLVSLKKIESVLSNNPRYVDGRILGVSRPCDGMRNESIPIEYEWLQKLYMSTTRPWVPNTRYKQLYLLNKFQEENPRITMTSQRLSNMFEKLGFAGNKTGGRHWVMMPDKDFEYAMKKLKYWNSSI